jgi:membrane-bound lytic murein transglycosylase B
MLRFPAAVGLAAVLAFVPATAQELPPVSPVVTASERQPFDAWLEDLRAEALSRGIRPQIVDRAFADVEAPVDTILERDRGQAEFTLELDAYLARRLTKPMIRTAQQMYSRHRTLLGRVAAKYNVSPRVIVAVWGIESNFGRFSGVRPTIPALATLAYDPRRATFFREQLFDALEILNRGDIGIEKLKGSWAGALGQPQFMPSSYLEYAQDFDGDGQRDIWTSLPDVFASVANYLAEHGWSEEYIWGREVKLTPAARRALDRVPRRDTGCRAEQAMTERRPLSEWRAMGLRTTANRPIPSGSLPASVVAAGSRTFLVYGNYEAILAYNCAHTYALSVALLSDRLK